MQIFKRDSFKRDYFSQGIQQGSAFLSLDGENQKCFFLNFSI